MPQLHDLQQLKTSHLSLVCELAERSDPHAWTASQWASNLKQDWVLGAFDQQQIKCSIRLVYPEPDSYQSLFEYAVLNNHN